MEEIVLSLTSKAYPITAVSQKDPEAKLVIFYGCFDPDAGTATATHELYGPAETLPMLEAAHSEAYPSAEPLKVEPQQSRTSTVDVDVASLEKASSPEVFAFRAFPRGTVLGPVIFKDGTMYIRAIVPDTLDLTRVQEVHKAGADEGRWSEFQVLRTGEFSARLAGESGLAQDLTPKQFEVVKAALSLGYYESPRKVTLQHLSDLYGISKAAAHNRLQAAERKIIQTYFS